MSGPSDYRHGNSGQTTKLMWTCPVAARNLYWKGALWSVNYIATRQTVTNGGTPLDLLSIYYWKVVIIFFGVHVGVSQTHIQAAAVIECMNGIAINSHQIKMYVGTTTHSTETDRTQGRIGYRTGPLAWLKTFFVVVMWHCHEEWVDKGSHH